MLKEPNFFIIGAPKCGTTALAEYLNEHPNVFISTPKEPHYFASDMIYHRAVETAHDYFDLFKDVNPGQTAVGEASVWYMYSQKAIENIAIFNEKAKLIVMLRKPVDMVYSLHSQQCFNLQEDEKDFEKAWDLEPLRKRGKAIPKNVYHVPNLFYSEVAKYHEQLKRVYRYFPKNQVKIILFDEFIKNTSQVYRDVQFFLNVPFYKKTSFLPMNPNKGIRSKRIQKVTVIIHKNRELINSLKKTLGLNRIGISSVIRRINTFETNRKPMHPLVKARVVEHYKNEVEKLSQLINIDLSHWNKV